MLPLSLLNAAQSRPMLVELKNGETFNGHLVACDNFMNITLREVYQTSADADRGAGKGEGGRERCERWSWWRWSWRTWWKRRKRGMTRGRGGARGAPSRGGRGRGRGILGNLCNDRTTNLPILVSFHRQYSIAYMFEIILFN
ncbi:Sm-like ribonucleo [Pyrrhoderma noxium]|uniref:LSM complex subunit LSM4 n=1 Tax=Pyrrhoderma noxium TaxID=2282107 RepID=A0A286UXG3_9AGAM|nr:Sm-like ribonucleo [Pyrrhoderma noxium]